MLKTLQSLVKYKAIAIKLDPLLTRLITEYKLIPYLERLENLKLTDDPINNVSETTPKSLVGLFFQSRSNLTNGLSTELNKELSTIITDFKSDFEALHYIDKLIHEDPNSALIRRFNTLIFPLSIQDILKANTGNSLQG